MCKKFVAMALECNEKTNPAGPGFKPGWVLGWCHAIDSFPRQKSAPGIGGGRSFKVGGQESW